MRPALIVQIRCSVAIFEHRQYNTFFSVEDLKITDFQIGTPLKIFLEGAAMMLTHSCEVGSSDSTESPLGYHSCNVELLTVHREPVSGQCLVGSLTGAIASQKITEAPKDSLNAVGNHTKNVKAERNLTARHTI